LQEPTDTGETKPEPESIIQPSVNEVGTTAGGTGRGLEGQQTETNRPSGRNVHMEPEKGAEDIINRPESTGYGRPNAVSNVLGGESIQPVVRGQEPNVETEVKHGTEETNIEGEVGSEGESGVPGVPSDRDTERGSASRTDSTKSSSVPERDEATDDDVLGNESSVGDNVQAPGVSTERVGVERKRTSDRTGENIQRNRTNEVVPVSSEPDAIANTKPSMAKNYDLRVGIEVNYETEEQTTGIRVGVLKNGGEGVEGESPETLEGTEGERPTVRQSKAGGGRSGQLHRGIATTRSELSSSGGSSSSTRRGLRGIKNHKKVKRKYFIFILTNKKL
jgi:hypothetical protein